MAVPTATIGRALTWFQLLMFLLFGVWGFANPQSLAGLSDISLPDNLAVAEFRSFYGGSAMGVAVLLGLALRAGRWRDALWVQAAVYGSIVCGRLLQLASAGSLESQTFKLLLTEAASFAAAAWLLSRKTD